MDDMDYLLFLLDPVNNTGTNHTNTINISTSVLCYGLFIIFIIFFLVKLGYRRFQIMKFNSFFIPNYNNINYSDKCSICLEKFNRDTKTLVCKHNFHPDCIINWLEIKEECPNCRNNLNNTVFNV